MSDLSSDELREERELRMALIRADIENKQADTEAKRVEVAYKRRLTDLEPWKLAFGGLAAGAAAAGALIALGAHLFK